MPQVRMPDGTVVAFPDDMPADQIKQMISTKFPEAAPQPAPDGVSVAGDVAASGASGAARGTADLIGLPGSIANAMNSAGQWALGKGYELATGEAPNPRSESMVERFFATPDQEMRDEFLFGGRNPVSGETLRSGLSTISGGATDYQPKTTAGKYARTVGEFAPGAAVFGGLSAPNMIRSAVAPAVASEAAGQATEGTALEPYARFAGAIAGGVAANSLKGASSKSPKLPTAQEIKDMAGYQQLKPAMQSAQLDQNTYKRVVTDLWKEAQDFGMTTKIKGEFGGVLRDYAQRAQASNGGTLYDLELLRRSLRNVADNTMNKTTQALSSRLVDKLDVAVDQLSAANIAASGATGTPVVNVLKDARQAYRVGIKAQIIENATEHAKNAASGFENGLRVEFRKLLRPNVAKNFDETELQAIRSVVRGTPSANALRWLGGFGVPVDNGRNFLGSVIGGGVGSTIGSMVAGPAGAAVGGPLLMGVGTAAKLGANAATRNQAGLVDALVKGGPAASKAFEAARLAVQQARREAIMRGVVQGVQGYQTGSRAAVRPGTP